MRGSLPRFTSLTRHAVLASAMLWPIAGIAADTVAIQLNQARIVRLPEKTKTVIVGNPVIADVAVQKHGNMVLTGKSYGTTNLIAMDDAGNIIAESMITVNAAREGLVIVSRGGAQQTLSCTPLCEKTITLGDDTTVFGDVSSQVQARTQISQPGK
ncbi:MAG: pilus assembly protein N-terminal domain-containing protein [Beijerinckiaceae bacterium]